MGVGNQVWNGNIGTLMANDRAKDSHTRSWKLNDTPSRVITGVLG